MHKEISATCIRGVSVQLNIYSVSQCCKNMPVFASSSTDYLVTDTESHVIPSEALLGCAYRAVGLNSLSF